MYSFLSLSTWPSVRKVMHSSSTGPWPLRAYSTASLAAA